MAVLCGVRGWNKSAAVCGPVAAVAALVVVAVVVLVVTAKAVVVNAIANVAISVFQCQT